MNHDYMRRWVCVTKHFDLDQLFVATGEAKSTYCHFKQVDWGNCAEAEAHTPWCGVRIISMTSVAP